MLTKQSVFVLNKAGANLDDKHRVYYISYLIEIFKELYPDFFKSKRLGRKREYTLEELLGLNTLGDWINHESCRKKAELCKNDDKSVEYLINGQPSKTTINHFINTESVLINAFDEFIVEFCNTIGLVGGNVFTGDGTFLNSYSNDFKGLLPEEIYYVINFLTNTIQHEEDYKLLYSYYYEDKELNNEINTLLKDIRDNINIHGLKLIIRALRSSKDYDQVMCKLEHMVDNITKEKIKVSIVDPDAHYMKDKDNLWGFRYNYQELTDTKYGIIVDHYVTNKS